jgi:LAO/AO transport system ATPase
MMQDPMQDSAAQLLAGDRGATARAISAVENDAPESGPLLRAIHAHIGRARVLGITGPPGAGKSTLTSALIGEYLNRGLRVAVVAVDPSSPISGGAILGDRIRMGVHQSDERVFIRSVASRGYPGGLSRTTSRVIDVLDAAGYAVVIVETVGAGQSDVEIGLLADTRVVICPAGLGDEVQAIKSGLLEIADIYAVNKADSPFAERTEGELAGMIRLRTFPGWVPRIVRTVATTGAGVPALLEAIAAHECSGGVRIGPRERVHRLIAAGASDWVKGRIESLSSPALDALCEAYARGEVGPREAWQRALALAFEGLDGSEGEQT